MVINLNHEILCNNGMALSMKLDQCDCDSRTLICMVLSFFSISKNGEVMDEPETYQKLLCACGLCKEVVLV